MRAVIVVFLVIAALVLGVLGWSTLQSADPYTRMFGLILLGGGAGLAIAALLVMAGSRNRGVSLVASAILLALVAMEVIGKLSR